MKRFFPANYSARSWWVILPITLTTCLLAVYALDKVTWPVLSPRAAGYPVRVTLSLDYGDHHFEKSFLTIAHRHFCYPESYECWDLSRSRAEIPFQDGSFVVAGLERPRSLEPLQVGQPRYLPADWLWVDNFKLPKQSVSGNSSTSITYKPAVVWLQPQALVERVSDQFFTQAEQADASSDPADRGPNESAPETPPSGGNLFVGYVGRPLFAEISRQEIAIAGLKNGTGWSNAHDGCRILPIFPGPGTKASLGDFEQQVGLMKRGGIWTSDNGPGWREPNVMYDSGVRIDGNRHYDTPYESLVPVWRMVHAVQWEGQVCTGIDLRSWPNASGLIIRFPNDALGVITHDSLAIVWDSWRKNADRRQ